MAGGGKPEIYQRTPARELSATLSPDGRWVAYTATEGEARGFYVQSFPEPGSKYQIAVPDAEWGLWSDRGDELVVVTTRDEVFAVKVSTANGFQPGAATRLFRPPADSFVLDIAPGQQRFLTVTPKNASTASRFEVALGWTQLLERK